MTPLTDHERNDGEEPERLTLCAQQGGDRRVALQRALRPELSSCSTLHRVGYRFDAEG